jgi:hypothetical protein
MSSAPESCVKSMVRVEGTALSALAPLRKVSHSVRIELSALICIAAAAMTQMNGTRMGNQIIQVTLHEPRQTRMEKEAEMARGLPFGQAKSNIAAYRKSLSPVRSSARLRNIVSMQESVEVSWN